MTEFCNLADPIIHSLIGYLQMNTALDSLVPAVQQLTSVYRASASGTNAERENDCPVFLSHFDLEPYHRTEERYTQTLVAFTKKQFFEVMFCYFYLMQFFGYWNLIRIYMFVYSYILLVYYISSFRMFILMPTVDINCVL